VTVPEVGDQSLQIRARGNVRGAQPRPRIAAGRGRGWCRQVRRELVRYFARAAALTDETVARIERAGTPEIDDRERLVADFTGLVEDTGGLFTDAGDEVRALEIRDRAEFQARVSEIAERLEERAATVVAEFTELAKRYDTPELDRAFSENEDCAQFSGAP
jgi:hypothetical protein